MPVSIRRAAIVVAALLFSGCAQAEQPSKVGCGSSAGRHLPLLSQLRESISGLLFGHYPKTQCNSPAVTLQSIKEQYEDEFVLRFNTTSHEERKSLLDACSRLFLDVWTTNLDFTDIRLRTDDVTPLLGLIPRSLQASHTTVIADLANIVYSSLPPASADISLSLDAVMASSASALQGDNLFFQDYQPLSVIIRWMRLLEAMFPSHVEYITVGKSYENRDIPALRVGASQSNGHNPRKTLVVTGGLHAREWISTTTVNYVAWSFVTAFEREPMITKFLYNFDIVFIPVMNPDGVEFSWTNDRLWRKSRQHTNFRFCKGMDLDHAFGFGWGTSKSDPCSESYGGDQPFQAVEAQSLAEWARNETTHNVQFVGLVDLHSYSQQILFPYSHSCLVEPPNMENLQELAAGIAKSIRLSNGQIYTVASACEATSNANTVSKANEGESAGGSAIDWFYHEMSAHFSYQIKLRDTGSYGFLLPREQIIPSGEEIFDALKYVGDYLLGNNGIERIEQEVKQTSVDSMTEVDENPELRRRVRKF